VLAFIQTFVYDNQITSIPAGLFRYNTKVTNFNGVFDQTHVASIPAKLFSGNTKVTSFIDMFSSTYIVSIPAGLFDAMTGVTSGWLNFNQCPYLTGVTAGLFDKWTKNTTFASTFASCQSLSYIPPDLFRYNTLVTDFSFVFNYNRNGPLTSVPAGLFKYNLLATNFYGAFQRCNNLVLNQFIFDTTGTTGSTRFLNQNVNFSNCFELDSYWDGPYYGANGTAPELWGYNFGTGVPTKTQCFKQRNVSGVTTNYLQIPVAWV
jgi:hypothetical protein